MCVVYMCQYSYKYMILDINIFMWVFCLLKQKFDGLFSEGFFFPLNWIVHKNSKPLPFKKRISALHSGLFRILERQCVY